MKIKLLTKDKHLTSTDIKNIKTLINQNYINDNNFYFVGKFKKNLTQYKINKLESSIYEILIKYTSKSEFLGNESYSSYSSKILIEML